MRQPSWDKYEAALLIEAYCKIKNNATPRKTVIAELSAELRSRAEKRGITVDDTYRNENGISMRLGELDFLFLGDGVGLKNTSDLFRQMVQMYENDKAEFQKLLMEAKGMSNNHDNIRQQFCEWLTTTAPKVQPDSLCRFLPIAEEFCLKIKVLSAPLFETTDEATIKRFMKTVNQNKIFRIKNKKQINSITDAANWYYAFIKALPSIVPTKAIDEDTPVAVEETNSAAIVDFNNVSSLTYTRPIAFTYRGLRDESVSNWTDLYVKLFKCIYAEYAAVIPVGQSFNTAGRPDFGSAEAMTAPKPITDSYSLETNFSATDIAKKISSLLGICGIPFTDVTIEYQEKKSSDANRNDVPQTATRSNVSSDTTAISFAEWLRVIEKMADGTCRSYVSAINKAEDYAQTHSLSNVKISGTDSAEALATIACLMADDGFRQVNQDQHNRFSAAFQKMEKYLQYLNSDSTQPTDVGTASWAQTKKQPLAPKVDTALATLTEALSLYLKEHTDGISKDDILAHFNKCSTQQVNRALLSCHAVKILKKYYHKDNISDFDEMADILLDVLLKQFSANGDYTSAQQLYNDAHFRLDDFFFYNNAFESRSEVYDLAVHLFTQEKYKGYTFLFSNGMHIWKTEPDYPKDFHGLLIKFARDHQNTFTREQALEYFDLLGSGTPAQTFSLIINNNGSNSFLQYDENCFILKEALHIGDNFLSALSAQIVNLLEGDSYIAFGEIDDYFYTTLPAVPANIRWTPLLLEDVLRVFDIGYKTVEAGDDNDKKTIPAAILKKQSQFKTFSDLVWNEVSKAYSLPKEFTASDFREFLLDKGFIHGSEKMWNVHKTVAGDLRFYWTEKNSRVTIN